MEKSVGYGAFMLLNKFASIPFSPIESPSWNYRHLAAVHGQLSMRRKLNPASQFNSSPVPSPREAERLNNEWIIEQRELIAGE
jgi:hypothetical protein